MSAQLSTKRIFKKAFLFHRESLIAPQTFGLASVLVALVDARKHSVGF
jgi:hypothetical protein